jgi:L-rhamnose isomerase
MQRWDRASAMLVEYKPFVPAFYHADVADWGMDWSWPGALFRKPRCSSTSGITTKVQTWSRLWHGSWS